MRTIFWNLSAVINRLPFNATGAELIPDLVVVHCEFRAILALSKMPSQVHRLPVAPTPRMPCRSFPRM